MIRLHILSKPKFKLAELAVLLGLIFSVAFTLMGFTKNCDDISHNILRLHVLANSDSKEDQELKLKVRDKVIEYSSNMMDSAQNRDQAEEIMKSRIKDIEEVAAREIKSNGYDYAVKAQLVNMYFNTREYDKVTLPAGYYDAVRISIGEAKGKNWWCVMFPPMCLPAAEQSKELAEVLDGQQMEIVEGPVKYELKFKVVEFIQSLNYPKESIIK